MQIDPEYWCIQDKKLIGIIRSLNFGEITIKIRSGKPVMIESGIRTISLTEQNINLKHLKKDTK